MCFHTFCLVLGQRDCCFLVWSGFFVTLVLSLGFLNIIFITCFLEHSRWKLLLIVSDICDKSRIFILNLNHLSEKEIYSSVSVLAEFTFEVQQGLFRTKRSHYESINKDCLVK